MKNCPASQGDELRRGGGGSRPREHNTGGIHGQHKRVEKRGKSLLCMGNPSGPLGQLPYKAEEFFLACFATPSSCIDK